MNPGNHPEQGSLAECAGDPALAEVARRFPEDLKVAAKTAQALRSAPEMPLDPRQEPWPPMRMPS